MTCTSSSPSTLSRDIGHRIQIDSAEIVRSAEVLAHNVDLKKRWSRDGVGKRLESHLTAALNSQFTRIGRLDFLMTAEQLLVVT